MNYYLVVEGTATEYSVFPAWLNEWAPQLTRVNYAFELTSDNYYIISGNGYPQYFDIIENAVREIIDNPHYGRLIICVDAEDMELNNKTVEIQQVVLDAGGAHLDYRIVVQNFCFECWALGNTRIARKPATDPDLLAFRTWYNVKDLDPEYLPPLVGKGNRSQFAFLYLKRQIANIRPRLSYSKNNPDFVANPTFFNQLLERSQQTAHLQSFRTFLDAFR